MNAPERGSGPPPIWTTGSTEVFKTGTWRAARPHYVQAPSPCHQACPVGGDIAEWIGLARAQDFRGAWEVLTRHNPFPAVAGRICHHPCEAACNRAGFDASLAICKLERLVGDMAIRQGWSFAAPEIERDQHVAVVGGGPSGLSAAFHLRRRGYRVTVFEAQRELGGLMRYGIPAYRLARSVLDGELARLHGLGIEFKLGEKLATDQDMEQLRTAHDAVYLAIGAGRPKRLAQLPAAAPWLMDGAEYLARSNAGAVPQLGRRLVVVGGGSAALDAARSARRSGHEVTLLALESAAQMPAQAEELREALEEGIRLVDGAMLKQVTTHYDAGIVLNCVQVNFEIGAQRGQFRITPIEGSEFLLAADAVITSIGQDPELAPMAGRFAIDGALVKVDATQASNVERVWAGGDVSSMARFVTEAIGMGQRAAQAIDAALQGLAPGANVPEEPVVTLKQIATFYYPQQARVTEGCLPPAERLASGAEVQLGLEFEQALLETERCFSCGTCIHCDNCFHLCPDLAVKRVNGGYEVLTDYCKGCGVCVRECPTGSMTMREEVR
jgi:NADPH-dependent glutamate synthase beta subunit-like oxidoreductase/Pyruvate/2-oxoacid:ferredoxin oxidoreductase delta subunit